MAMFESEPYTISRMKLAYVAAEEYIRNFWFFVVSVPLGGLALLLLAQDRTLSAIGYLALLWPASIPARAILISTKASRLFSSGVRLRVSPQGFEFLGTQPGPNGLPLRLAINRNALRDVVRRQGLLLVRTKRLTFAPVDPSVLPQDANLATLGTGDL